MSQKQKSCFTCRWSRWNGPHLGCYYGGEFRKWLNQKKAKVFAVCEEIEPVLARVYGCKWEPETREQKESRESLTES